MIKAHNPGRLARIFMFSRKTTQLLTIGSIVYGVMLFIQPSGVPAAQPTVLVSLTASPSLIPAPVVSPSLLLEESVEEKRESPRPVKVTKRIVMQTAILPSTQIASSTPTSVPNSPVAVPSSVPTVTPSFAPVIPQISYRIETGSSVIEGASAVVGRSVGEATRQITQSRGISFVYETSDLGWFVTEIAGIRQSVRTGQYWLFYVDGALANKGADQVMLKEGDSLVWRFEKI